MVVNAAQLATYSQAKQAILNSGYIQVILKRYNLVIKFLHLATSQDGIFCHFVASMISGLVTTIASMPVERYLN